jgi:hypothetical protein
MVQHEQSVLASVAGDDGVIWQGSMELLDEPLGQDWSFIGPRFRRIERGVATPQLVQAGCPAIA